MLSHKRDQLVDCIVHWVVSISGWFTPVEENGVEGYSSGVRDFPVAPVRKSWLQSSLICLQRRVASCCHPLFPWAIKSASLLDR